MSCTTEDNQDERGEAVLLDEVDEGGGEGVATDTGKENWHLSARNIVAQRVKRLPERLSTVRWTYWRGKAMERWDIVLAGVVLLGAILVLLGWRRIVVSSGCLSLGVVVAEIWPCGTRVSPLPRSLGDYISDR